MNVILLIQAIKKRPLFFLINHSIYDFDAFIRGYRYYQFSHNVNETKEDIYFDEFKNDWLKHKLGININAPYVQYLLLVSDNSTHALDTFFEYWELFINEKKIKG